MSLGNINDIATVIERRDCSLADLGLTLAEGRSLLAKADLLAPVFMRFLYAPPTFLSCFYDRVAKLQAESIQGCIVMDGIFLIVLIGFAVLSAALLGLCAALAPKSPAGSEHGGPHNQMLVKNSASDRGL